MRCFAVRIKDFRIPLACRMYATSVSGHQRPLQTKSNVVDVSRDIAINDLSHSEMTAICPEIECLRLHAC